MYFKLDPLSDGEERRQVDDGKLNTIEYSILKYLNFKLGTAFPDVRALILEGKYQFTALKIQELARITCFSSEDIKKTIDPVFKELNESAKRSFKEHMVTSPGSFSRFI